MGRSAILRGGFPGTAASLTPRPGRGYESERMRPLASLLAAAAVAWAGRALAGPSITLNGVPIDGATSQKFENCTVTIDALGNVHIEAKGYAVKGGGGATEGPIPPPRRPMAADASQGAPGKLSRRYFLATEHSPPGTQYDLAVFINAQWIREVKATDPQVVMEITKYLRPGSNKVTFAATKRIAGERLAYGKDVQLRVVIGEGNVGGDHVMIDVPLVEMARNASEVDDRTEEFVVEAR
jgi:hypothetical protein